MRQKRNFGQVFLKDKSYIDKILERLEIRGKAVVEIGPGEGVMSEGVCKAAGKLYCVEVDKRFSFYLTKKFKQNNNVEIINKDILKFNLFELGADVVIFGNVPYQISSQLINYFIKNRGFISKAYLTFQKEFVDKLIAKPSAGKFSYLSCYIQYYAKVKKIFDIPAKAFNPVPRVNSSFIELEFYKNPLHAVKDEKFLFQVIREAFSNRRKKIVNSLAKFKIKEDFFLNLNINPNLRPENIPLKEYVSIANTIIARVDPCVDPL